VENQIVVMMGAMHYGATASIGMVATHPDHQRKGYAHFLMTHLLTELEQRGATITFLDATVAGVPLYLKLGFQPDGRSYRFDLPHTPLTEPYPAGVRPMREADLPALVTFDRDYFGGDRSQVLSGMFRRYPDRGVIAYDDQHRITGYGIGQRLMIGPWVAKDETVAEVVLRALLTFPYDEPPRVIFSSGSLQAIALVKRYGGVQLRDIQHMRRGGDRDPRQLEHLYAQASFMAG
jgi:ribosomal protein S18 acetylase RimI-like enzyme